jgi:hypothetical protein
MELEKLEPGAIERVEQSDVARQLGATAART